ETAAGFELMQVVTATYMRLTDENLRHGTTAAAGHHFRTRLGTRINVNFLESDGFALEKLTRARAVGAPARYIHHDFGIAHAAPAALNREPAAGSRCAMRSVRRAD